MSFVHLHVHSFYSLLRGADSVENLCARAAEYNMPALALTDRNGLYGAVAFQQACIKYNLKPIFGAQLVTPETSCVALAKNSRGYRNLCRIITDLHRSPDEGSNSLSSLLADHREGLIHLSRDTMLLGEVKKACGPDDLYVEIFPGIEAASWQTHLQTSLPLVATNNVWFVGAQDYVRHRLLTAINLNTCLSALPPEEIAHRAHWLKPPQAMQKLFTELPQAVANTKRLARECNFNLELDTLRLPKFPFTDGRPAIEVLREKTMAGLVRRYGVVGEKVRTQTEHELDIIHEMGYADYFLIVADIVEAATKMGIPTCGRGSAANSVVAYVLGLTQVEPLSNNLYFERFLNRGRSDCPDVDLDFSWCERDKVIDWVFKRYGRERVAMISTHVTFGARGAVREIAKVWGLSPAQISKVSKQLPSGWDRGPISEAAIRDPRSRGLPVREEPWSTVFRLAEQINGFPKHLGVHSGGIVISPTPLTDYVPLQPAAKEIGSGKVIVTQWDMYPVEDAGLVKIDLLGNRSLAVINDVIKAVWENTGKRIDYTKFDPTTDEKTKGLIRRGETMGCFYIESPSMRNLLCKLDCHTFDGLVAASSIIRPGIASSGMMQEYILREHYVRRQGRQDDSWYLHPLMRQALNETYGVMAYQEDVLKVAEMIARMSPEDSDSLRKAMSKKRDFVAIEGYRRQFIAGAVANSCPPETARELWRQIESFSGYSFCKAHSASYALVSYQSTYLRAHYPAEFMAAVLSNHGGYYSTLSYISEARRMGLQILPPCVNQSELHYTGSNNTVRLGLGQLQQVHRENLEQLLIERRRGGLFRNFGDFLNRVSLPAKEIDCLIRAGALDDLTDSLNRPQLMRQHVLSQATSSASNRKEHDLFNEPVLPPAPLIRDYTAKQKLAYEAETLGFVVSVHPLQMFANEFRPYRTIDANSLPRYVGRQVSLAGWQVTRKRLRTKDKEPMAFVTFEDTTALYETVIFPRVYDRLVSLLSFDGPFLVTGEVTEELGVLILTIKDLRLLAEKNNPSANSRTDSLWSTRD